MMKFNIYHLNKIENQYNSYNKIKNNLTQTQAGQIILYSFKRREWTLSYKLKITAIESLVNK